ncbi:hypothetical protein B7P43_G18136 [Cryptotermes secundus]|uniref:BZIP domain-containing protein n=1 Tax=Cryptotermes secundus TaxID=105785 RepID=A0A2J7PTJ5_9NEOP|nr:hypothetical protein B7P43_G18136 [Cryptotermes secundus]
MARISRLKKKNFLEYLENQVARLTEENARLKQINEGQSSVVCSLRKEVHYLKAVLANNKDISMLIKSIHNTGLPVTTSLRKTADPNFLCTRSDSSIATSVNDLFDKDSATVASDMPLLTPSEIDEFLDVSISLSVPPDDTLDLPLLTPSEIDAYDTEFLDDVSISSSVPPGDTLDLPLFDSL